MVKRENDIGTLEETPRWEDEICGYCHKAISLEDSKVRCYILKDNTLDFDVVWFCCKECKEKWLRKKVIQEL